MTEGRFAQAFISAPHLPVVSGQFCAHQNGCSAPWPSFLLPCMAVLGTRYVGPWAHPTRVPACGPVATGAREPARGCGPPYPEPPSCPLELAKADTRIFPPPCLSFLSISSTTSPLSPGTLGFVPNRLYDTKQVN